MGRFFACILCLLLTAHAVAAQQQETGARVLSGVVFTAREELAPGVNITVTSPAGELQTVSDAEGGFRLVIPDGMIVLKLSGENIAPATKEITAGAATENLRLVSEYVVPLVHESVVIVDSSLQPGVERRNEEIYRGTLFSRDDQLFDTLAAGINAGQHEGGLRYDYFRFDVEDLIRPAFSGQVSDGRIQPKAAVAYTPSHTFPATLHFNHGRGISSQDARGVARRPESPKIATTDFYQPGTSHNFKKFSASADLFLTDNSNQQVYIPDDGSIEFAGPSRAYGFEVKKSLRLTRQLTFNGGLTRVMNAFYRDTRPREYVDSAPHTVANAGFTLSDYRGFSGSLRYRHTSNYRLDPLDAHVRASGLGVVDLSVNKRLRRSILRLIICSTNATSRRRTISSRACVPATNLRSASTRRPAIPSA